MPAFLTERVDGRIGQFFKFLCILVEKVLRSLERFINDLLGVHQIAQFRAKDGDYGTHFNFVAFDGYVPADVP